MATTEGKKRASVWGRSAPALPFGQSACGGHGLRSTPPNAAGPGAAPGLLTRNTAPATLSLQAGPVRLHYYILNCPGDCRKMGVSSDTVLVSACQINTNVGHPSAAPKSPFRFLRMGYFRVSLCALWTARSRMPSAMRRRSSRWDSTCTRVHPVCIRLLFHRAQCFSLSTTQCPKAGLRAQLRRYVAVEFSKCFEGGLIHDLVASLSSSIRTISG